MLPLLSQRLVRALGTTPRPGDYLLAGSVLTVFAAVALPVGLASGLLHVSMPTDPGRQALFALVAVIVPCLGEEVLFRVLLVPHSDEPRPWVGQRQCCSSRCGIL
jgi:predicted Abi (CAAX) family protease